MKKKLGVLVLTVSSLVLSAACASSTGSGSGQPDPGHDDTSGKLDMNWIRRGPLPRQPSEATAASATVPATELASR